MKKLKYEDAESFSRKVQEYVERTKSSYIDGVIHICEEEKIDVENSAKLLTVPLCEKIEMEAKDLNYRVQRKKISGASLPLE